MSKHVSGNWGWRNYWKEDRDASCVAKNSDTEREISEYWQSRFSKLLDGSRILEFVEKPKKGEAPSNFINAGFYILEPEVLDVLYDQPNVSDFDIEVLPTLLGKIATWENTNIHRDIGTLGSLLEAQNDPKPNVDWLKLDSWQRKFENHIINKELKGLLKNSS